MTKGVFAKEEVMEEYLSDLLTEPVPAEKIQRERVARLLDTASEKVLSSDIQPTPATEPSGRFEPKVIEIQVETKVDVVSSQIQQEGEGLAVKSAPEVRPQEAFQALFFEVAGLKLAVPLTELGGIHQLDKIGPLFGKPAWFKGVMLHRERKLNVVDTALWVMPEKYNEKLAESLNYQYLIMLDDSCWGLSCEHLVNTAVLQPNDIKWRPTTGKRPWLAGMVKEKMCALINVRQLIAMLDQGLGSNDK